MLQQNALWRTKDRRLLLYGTCAFPLEEVDVVAMTTQRL